MNTWQTEEQTKLIEQYCSGEITGEYFVAAIDRISKSSIDPIKNNHMNTEYKFRAYNEKNKHMAYQGTPDLETLQSFIHHYGSDILMLNTGKKDKKGKEIYDRDLLKVKWSFTSKHQIHEVYYSKHAGGFVITMENISGKFDEVYLTRVVSQRYCEIVGNVYENRDLIE